MSSKDDDHAAKVRQAEEVLSDLKEALKGKGITLPSLEIDCETSLSGVVLIDLARCNIETAQKLAKALRLADAKQS
ncbi:hypothetical protein [Streptomyces daliensis]|uniref:Uncharacterized protein n=1 Tax=Streptomyces daliensis TaxID=299421 RepID=A0A8T4J041_9ACTN|nr:hypothetical protein [Streptomyces daliensis]